MKTAHVNGTELAYEDEGQGLPILLLHAFPLSSRIFRPQLERLSRRYRVIAPDHRGFGRSPVDPNGKALEMRQIAQDALSLLDQLRIRTAVVGGVSMGGYAAMALLREDAGRVKGLMLIDTQPGADDATGKENREKTAQAVERDGMQVMVDTMLPKLLGPGASAEVKETVEQLIRANPPAGTAAASRGMALRSDSKDVLARYAGPTLVIVGEQDVITPPEKAKQMAELVTGAKLAVLPGAGHLSNLENPDAFHAAVEPFLAGLK